MSSTLISFILSEDDIREEADKEAFKHALSNLKTFHFEQSWNVTRVSAFCDRILYNLKNIDSDNIIELTYKIEKNGYNDFKLLIKTKINLITVQTEIDPMLLYCPECPKNLDKIIAEAFLDKYKLKLS